MTAAITLKPLVIPDDQALIPGGASPELMHLLNDIKSRFDTIAAYQEPVIPDDVVLQTRDLVDGAIYSATSANPIPADNTIPQVTEGVALQSLDFTPVRDDSTIRVEWIGQVTGPTSASSAVALFQSGSTDAIDAKFGISSSTAILTWTPKLVATIASWGLTQRTFSARFATLGGSTVYAGSSSNGTDRFGGVTNSVLTITEYKNLA